MAVVYILHRLHSHGRRASEQKCSRTNAAEPRPQTPKTAVADAAAAAGAADNGTNAPSNRNTRVPVPAAECVKGVDVCLCVFGCAEFWLDCLAAGDTACYFCGSGLLFVLVSVWSCGILRPNAACQNMANKPKCRYRIGGHTIAFCTRPCTFFAIESSSPANAKRISWAHPLRCTARIICDVHA